MKPTEIAEVFRNTGAFLEGHFILSSGLHSPNYMQCAKVLQYPEHGEKFARTLAAKLEQLKPTVVLAPALGGILVGYELARALRVRSIFAERVEGKMSLRRGQELSKGDRVVLCEDVVTTGKSIKEVEALCLEVGAEVVAMAAIVDRSGGKWALSKPLTSLLSMELVTHDPDNCPLCKAGSPAVKPGSRPMPS
ncbi:MAG TPA: orotate phosphoribosyltransferase [Fibrobacteria bacterium]|nr:orotate phosphoribosyltransferase [Fibrobacteria bacterium]HOX53005.1 orotate phosphoribosyltransferase [Fibrobacteria bacterium]